MFGFLGSWWGTSVPPAAPAETKYDPTDPKQNPLNPKGLKPCCACPETKSARDACFLKTDSSAAEEECRDLVQQHMACMRGYGFKV